MGKQLIRLTEVGKFFIDRVGHRTDILGGINVHFTDGEAIALRGNNGTGKTTLLNILAGLETPSSGELRSCVGIPGRLGFAQQDYTSSLLPWLTALENIALPLRLRGTPRTESATKARDLISRLSFEDLPLANFPHQLSGGQRQKVAITRALIDHPQLLLLDEPFANLDAITRRALRAALLAEHESSKFLMLLVSHDLDESILLSDRILILSGQPAKIAAEFKISLPRPRKTEDMFSDSFLSLRRQIVEFEEQL